MDGDRPSSAHRSPHAAAPGDLDVTVGQHATRVVVTARGELDLNTVAHLEAAVADHAGPRQDLVVDLGELTFVDSTGLRLLLRLRERAQRNATGLLVVTSERVRRILDLSGMAALFDCVDRPPLHAPPTAVPTERAPDGQPA